MTPADRVKALRKKLGLRAEAVAHEIEIEEAWYRDVEAYEDELESTLTLRQIQMLANILGASPHELIFGEPSTFPLVSLEDLPALINAHIQRSGQTLEAFEDQIGWEIGDPNTYTPEETRRSPMIFFKDLAEGLGIPYASFVP